VVSAGIAAQKGNALCFVHDYMFAVPHQVFELDLVVSECGHGLEAPRRVFIDENRQLVSICEVRPKHGQSGYGLSSSSISVVSLLQGDPEGAARTTTACVHGAMLLKGGVGL
jgi:hypothetical protein